MTTALSSIADAASARTVAGMLLAKNDYEPLTNAEYFTDAATALLAGMLLAAGRSGNGMRTVCEWADTLCRSGQPEPALKQIENVLTGPGTSPDDAHLHRDWAAVYHRVQGAPGERSAVWSMITRALTPSSSPAAANTAPPTPSDDLLDLWRQLAPAWIVLEAVQAEARDRLTPAEQQRIFSDIATAARRTSENASRDRRNAIRAMRESGMTLDEIATAARVTRPRISELLR